MTGLWASAARRGCPGEMGELVVCVELSQGVEGCLHFGFSKGAALGITEALTGTPWKNIDEMAVSALCEIGNITCGNAVARLALCGVNCKIEPPRRLLEQRPLSLELYTMDTDYGPISVGLQF
ncbi:chemotaxis protein CheX [Ruminococcaceae bacterium OttesenSCG-928-I18]|nr:chemotaxis protein CheX [Ruminococcaceae bacterium OttesenSCG-928-I18]